MPQDIFAQLIQAETRNRELLRLLESVKPTDLRDQFASAALTGLLANPVSEFVIKDTDVCYELADAMLKAREEQ